MNTQIDVVKAGEVAAFAVVSTMTGITLWPFALTAVFAVCALVYQDHMPVNKAFANVVVSTLIGGAIAQILAIPVLNAIARYFSFLSSWASTAEQSMVALIAIVFGLVAHVLMPALLKRIAWLGSKE